MNPAKITSEINNSIIEIEVKFRHLSPNLRVLMSRVEVEWTNKIQKTYKEAADEVRLSDKLTNYLQEKAGTKEKEELIADFNIENNCNIVEETEDISVARGAEISAMADKKFIALLNTIIEKKGMKANQLEYIQSPYESAFWQNADMKAVYDAVEYFRESTSFRRQAN